MSQPEPRSHAEWVRAAVARHETPLVQYAARLVGDPERARDVVQETFLRLCKQEREGVERQLAEWLYTVARNLALDVRKKEGRMISMTETAAEGREAKTGDPTAGIEQRDTVSKVMRTLERLPAGQREVLRLKFQHGLSYKEIARVTKQSVGNVGFLIHVGLKGLRQRLGEEQLEGSKS